MNSFELSIPRNIHTPSYRLFRPRSEGDWPVGPPAVCFCIRDVRQKPTVENVDLLRALNLFSWLKTKRAKGLRAVVIISPSTSIFCKDGMFTNSRRTDGIADKGCDDRREVIPLASMTVQRVPILESTMLKVRRLLRAASAQLAKHPSIESRNKNRK